VTRRLGPRRQAGRWPVAAVVAAVVAALVAGGCGQGGSGAGGDGAAPDRRDTGGQPGPAARSVAPSQPLYVAVGASESVGQGAQDPLSEAWPQVLFRTALPRETVFVNLGVPGSTVAEAITQQGPEAARLAPALVTVWLNVNDLLTGVRPADYEKRLTKLVHQVRRGGATKVLLANTPPLDRLPAYLACIPGGGSSSPCRLPAGNRDSLASPARLDALTSAYNAAIAKVAKREGAILVDLHAAGLAARAAGTDASLISPDGFHPSTAGHRAVAAAFANALRDAGGV
jgi:lysophospholipase L1-like esterase